MCAYIPHDIPACLHRRRRSCASAATGLAATKRTHGTSPTSTTRWPLMPPPPPAQPRLCRRVAWGPPHALRPLWGSVGGTGACSAGKEAQEVDPRERRGQRRLSATADSQVRAHRGGRARRAAVTRVRRCTRLWKPVNRTRQAGDHPRGEGRRSHGADRPSHVTRQQEQAHHSARYTRLFDLCTLRLYRPCALCHCAVCTDASFVYELKMYFVLREIYLHESSNVLFKTRTGAACVPEGG